MLHVFYIKSLKPANTIGSILYIIYFRLNLSAQIIPASKEQENKLI